MAKFKGILYINQFFGQIGGEEAAGFEPEIREGLIGPGIAYQELLGSDIEITHTIICGDNYMGSNTEEAVEKIKGFLKDKEFDVFFAGPAFRAGRYGVACGTICKAVQKEYNVPTFTSMNEENPGVEMFRKETYIFKGGASAASMKKDIEKVTSFAKRKLNKEETFWASKEGYYGRGIRHQVFLEEEVMAADRVVDMLLKVINNEEYITELPMETAEAVEPAPPIRDLSKAKIALVTSGGIIPKDNPDKIQSASATRWGKYDTSDMDLLKSGEYKTIHAGYDPTEADKNPNIVAPVDVLKEYEKEGKIGEFYKYFYSTVGTGTTQSEATRMGEEIAKELLEAQVDGVVLTST